MRHIAIKRNFFIGSIFNDAETPGNTCDISCLLIFITYRVKIKAKVYS